MTNAVSTWNDDEEETEPVDLVAMANWVPEAGELPFKHGV